MAINEHSDTSFSPDSTVEKPPSHNLTSFMNEPTESLSTGGSVWMETNNIIVDETANYLRCVTEENEVAPLHNAVIEKVVETFEDIPQLQNKTTQTDVDTKQNM